MELTQLNTHRNIHVYVYTYIHICVYRNIYVYIHMCVCICEYVNIYACIHMCVYIEREEERERPMWLEYNQLPELYYKEFTLKI